MEVDEGTKAEEGKMQERTREQISIDQFLKTDPTPSTMPFQPGIKETSLKGDIPPDHGRPAKMEMDPKGIKSTVQFIIQDADSDKGKFAHHSGIRETSLKEASLIDHGEPTNMKMAPGYRPQGPAKTENDPGPR